MRGKRARLLRKSVGLKHPVKQELVVDSETTIHFLRFDGKGEIEKVPVVRKTYVNLTKLAYNQAKKNYKRGL